MSNYQRIVGTTSGRQHHPEDRIDPGRELDHIAKTPKVVLTDHSAVDFAEVVRHRPLVVDTRGVTRGRRSNVVRL